MRKRPVSFNLSKRVLDRIDKEATRQKRSRSNWLEQHIEELYLKPKQT